MDKKSWIDEYVKESKKSRDKMIMDLLYLIPVMTFAVMMLSISFYLNIWVVWRAIAAAFGTIASIYAIRLFCHNISFILKHIKKAERMRQRIKEEMENERK